MKVFKTDISGVVIIEPAVYNDDRGYFFESFSEKKFIEEVCNTRFIQDNQSFSCRGVIRGLHYQAHPCAQSKLVRALTGRILDVAVDIRRGSPTFGRHVAVELSGDNHLQLFVPRGFAHGFSVLSDTAVVQYKCDNYYSPAHERSIVFNDRELGIDWKVDAADIVVSEKDRLCRPLSEADLFDNETNYYL